MRVAMPLEVPEHEGWVEADLDRLPDDGIRYELIDGSLQRKPADVALAVEIESRGSRRDDRRIKPEVYAEAGIPEYWLVDVRKAVRFDIFRHTSKGYVPVRKQQGWMKSQVFGKSFRLVQKLSSIGHPS